MSSPSKTQAIIDQKWIFPATHFIRRNCSNAVQWLNPVEINRKSELSPESASPSQQSAVLINSLLMTWTVTLAASPTEEWQAYWPVSEVRAWLTSREDWVVAPFSVIWLIPPRLELCEIGWNIFIALTNLFIFYFEYVNHAGSWAPDSVASGEKLNVNNLMVILANSSRWSFARKAHELWAGQWE